MLARTLIATFLLAQLSACNATPPETEDQKKERLEQAKAAEADKATAKAELKLVIPQVEVYAKEMTALKVGQDCDDIIATVLPVMEKHRATIAAMQKFASESDAKDWKQKNKELNDSLRARVGSLMRCAKGRDELKEKLASF